MLSSCKSSFHKEISYHVYYISDSTGGIKSLYLIKKSGNHTEQSILLDQRNSDHQLVYTVPDDAIYLGKVKEVKDDVLHLLDSEGGIEYLSVSSNLSWAFSGLMDNDTLVLVIKETSKVWFARSISRGLYKDNKKVCDAEWDAVLGMFPKATKQPLARIIVAPSRSKYAEEYDEVLEASMGSRGKRR